MSVLAPKSVLLVEGNTEKRVVPYLMEQRGVSWELESRKYVVDIRVAGGLVTAPGLLETHLQESSLGTLGVVFDADGINGAPQNRWAEMFNCCKAIGIALPELPPTGGFYTVLLSEVRFGVWMMPNNQPPGMLETFLLALLKPEEIAGPLFQHAQTSVERARELGAPFKAVHRDKALVHTWLAWQDQPGAQLHEAIKFKILDAASPKADAFAAWFRNLFEV